MPDILNIPGLRVLNVVDGDTQYLIEVETEDHRPEPCCLLQSTALRRNGKKRQAFRDIPMHDKYVEVAIDRQRFHCKECGKTVYEMVPGIDTGHRMTDRLAKQLARRAAEGTFSRVAREAGLSEGTIRNVFNAEVNKTKGSFKVVTPRVFGIDEKMLLGAYRCVIGNIEERTLLDILPTRFRSDIDDYLDRIEDKHKVEVVCHDMWDTYRAIARKHFPDAQIVVDKFHVVKLATDAMETIRRRANKDMTVPDRRKLKRQRTLMLMRHHRGDDRSRAMLQEWFDRVPVLGEAYWLKETFSNIYTHDNRADAIAAYREWEKTVPAHLEPYFRTIPTAMKRWSGHIFSYFDHRYTNSYVEGVNRMLDDLQRAGRGYSFDVIRAKALLTLGHQKWDAPEFVRKAHAGKLMTGLIDSTKVFYGTGIDSLGSALRSTNSVFRRVGDGWEREDLPSGISTLKIVWAEDHPNL